jgi:hypothetical protein
MVLLRVVPEHSGSAGESEPCTLGQGRATLAIFSNRECRICVARFRESAWNALADLDAAQCLAIERQLSGGKQILLLPSSDNS